jgi:anti-sigma-K factor RskA
MAAEAPIVTVSLEPMDQPDSPVPMGPVVATGQVRRL